MALKVKICDLDTHTLPKLSAKQCNELLVAYHKNKDSSARDKLFEGNIRLVLSIVQRFESNKVAADDLFQGGCVGLCKSIDNFNLDYGVQFSTYAVPIILGEIRKMVRESNSIKINRATRDIAYKCMQAKEKLTTSYKLPTFAEIAAEIGLTEWDVVCSLDAVSEPISLYASTVTDKDDTIFLLDQISDVKNNVEGLVENELLIECISGLPQKEKEVISLRYYGGRTQMEISEELSVSQAQVSRLEKCALERMRKSFLV